LREGDREKLADLARLPSVPHGLAKRARMILLAADGVPNAEIARLAGVSRPTVIAWRDRYESGGIQAVGDAPRSGRPAEIDEIEVVAATLVNNGLPPQRLGITHWSARFLAAELGISFATVARIWRKWGLQPHRLLSGGRFWRPRRQATDRFVCFSVRRGRVIWGTAREGGCRLQSRSRRGPSSMRLLLFLSRRVRKSATCGNAALDLPYPG
jgi:transposase